MNTQKLFPAHTTKRSLLLVGVFITIGVVTVLVSRAATVTTISVEPENGLVSENTKLVDDPLNASNGKYIRFSSNQSKDSYILFSSAQDSITRQIWRMKANGTEKIKLTDDTTSEHAWFRPSPDGTKILFMKAASGSNFNYALESNRLWIMNSDGTNQQEIISIAKREGYGWTGMAHADWSPDSTRIVLAAPLFFQTQLFIVDANGNNPQKVTSTTRIDGSDANVTDPTWAVTNELVYIRKWECFGFCGKHDVFKLNLTTMQETRLTNDPLWEWDPIMAPDGETISWLVTHNNSGVATRCDLVKGSAIGQLNMTSVVADGGCNANGTFSSDSGRILFLKTVGTKQSLHVVNVDGTGLVNLQPTLAGETGIAAFWP